MASQYRVALIVLAGLWASPAAAQPSVPAPRAIAGCPAPTGHLATGAAMDHAGHAQTMDHAAHAQMTAKQGTGNASASAPADSAFAAVQARGLIAMGVNQYTSTHRFETLKDGGRISLQRDVDDSAGAAQIRAHLCGIAAAFTSGDFSTPAFVHMQMVPGAPVMATKRRLISYAMRPLPRGGALRITTRDRGAIAAVAEFLAFQRKDHRTH